MTSEAQRIAIAEACGWTRDEKGFFYAPNQPQVWFKTIIIPDLPDYLNDLNAMHEAEQRVGQQQKSEFVRQLTKIACKNYCNQSWRLLHATAAQRAEAFLKTIGKWKE